MLTKRNIL